MKLNLFISAFMYELEKKLSLNLDYFNDVKFQFDEANTDQEIKNKLKKYIMDNFNKVEKITELVEDGETANILTCSYRIINVKVPSELNSDDKRFIKESRKSVYTNPDLLFFIDTGESIIRYPIEVKSTKTDKIPGSSIQQIDSDDWVIFLKHDERRVTDITTGKYVDSISGTIQFPDRSPRPQVSFNNLKTWNDNYRQYNNGKLIYLTDSNFEERIQILNDWQLSLAKKWLTVLNSKRKIVGEPWFNNNIRKFSALLLDYYDHLSSIEKEEFKTNIVNNVTEDNNE